MKVCAVIVTYGDRFHLLKQVIESCFREGVDKVIGWIKKLKENPNLYSEEKKKIKDKFHKYQDGKSCERVYQEIKRLLNE